jgi:PAS domain S-box-containing protein
MIRFLRVSPLRLALVYIALGVLVLGLFAIPLWYVWRENYWTLRTYVQGDDMQQMLDIFEREGAKGLAAAIDARIETLPRDQFMFLADASKARVAGNLPAWPAKLPDSPGTLGLVIDLGSSSLRVVVAHVRLPGGYHFLMGRESARFQSLVDLFWYGIAGATGIVLVLGAVVGWMIRRALLFEVQEISRTASAIVDGDLSSRVAVRGGSTELDALAGTVNGMLEQLATKNGELGNEITVRRQAEQALQRAHEGLEGLVAQRTAQLARTNESLRRSEAYLAEAQRLSLTGSFGWNVASGELVWSDETYKLLELDREAKPTLDAVLRRVHPEDLAFVRNLLERAARNREPLDFEHRLLLDDGSVKYLHVRARAAGGTSDALEYVGAVTDVTALRRSQQALETSFREVQTVKEEFRLAVDTISGLVWSSLPDGHVDFLNQRWREYTGLSVDEASGWGWQAAIFPDDLPELQTIWRSMLASGAAGEAEARLRRADGAYRWFLFRAIPLRDAAGRLIKWYGQTTDIEDRKRAESLLSAEKRTLEAIASGRGLVEILDDLCLTIDRHAPGTMTTILLMDPDGQRLWPFAGPRVPTGWTEVITPLTIGPEVGSCGTAAFLKQPVITSDIATDPLWDGYQQAALSHGLRASWSLPLISNGDKVLGTFAMYFAEARSPSECDIELITGAAHVALIAIERKRAEEALQQAQAELAHVARVATLGELTASIAHEINQPLGAVVNNAGACLRWLAGHNLEEARNSAALVISDGHRASEIIRRIRAMATKAPPRRDWLDINETIREVAALAQSELHRHGVALQTRLLDGGRDLPWIVADRIQLQQVVLNLIMNAIEAMSGAGDGPRELSIRSSTDGPQCVLIAVSDSGPGLDPKSVDRVFDAFYTTKPDGLGMGLAICRSIIEAHGGRLWASANEGRGATFQFNLPIGKVKAS